MKNKNKNIIKALLIILIFVTAGVIYSCTMAKPSAKKDDGEKISEETKEEGSAVKEKESAAMLCVYVCGCVKQPGVYYLKSGSRIHEAVGLAGGLSENASYNSVNLAEEISDGQQIYIPGVDEEVSPAAAAAAADDGLVNINTADQEQLKTLPGIGDVKARAIVEYRESAGSFQGPEEIMNVSGIKQSAYDKIKDKIKV